MISKWKYVFIVTFQSIFVYLNVLYPGTFFIQFQNGAALSAGIMTVASFLGGWFIFSILEKEWLEGRK